MKPLGSSSQPARMRCGKDARQCKVTAFARRNPHECAVAKQQPQFHIGRIVGRNPHECAVAKALSRLCSRFQLKSQPARMRCGKGSCGGLPNSVTCRNPRECAVAKAQVERIGLKDRVATRANALWQSIRQSMVSTGAESQPARMRCGKALAWENARKIRASQPARMRCGKAVCVVGRRVKIPSQPARMR